MISPNRTVGELVADDFRTAAVFQKHGIDFCCGGQRSIGDACTDAGIDRERVSADLEAATVTPGASPRFTTWPLDMLTRYIVSNHHRYVREAIETLSAHTDKVAHVHGEAHPEVREIGDLFRQLAAELASHMDREERVLFPYIDALAAGGAAPRAPFGTVANPIRMMEHEHQAAGSMMADIRRLSRDYAPPEDACTTYRVTYQELQAFEADLHQHVHLENNVLFPRAVALERERRG
jgi:regulator of cell morphogenesis and NO signaling